MGFKVCSDWRDIALTIRDSIFEDDEEQLIDVHDIKVKLFPDFFYSNKPKKMPPPLL